MVFPLIDSLPIDLYPVADKSITPGTEPSEPLVTKSAFVASENKPSGIVPSGEFGNLTVAKFSQPFNAYLGIWRTLPSIVSKSELKLSYEAVAG